MVVDCLQTFFSVAAASLCLNAEEYQTHTLPYLFLSLQGTHIFLIILKGGHNHDESFRVLTGDQGLLISEKEVLETFLEIDC